MKFGISSASFYPQLTERTVEELGERGIPLAEVFLNTVSEVSPPYLRELRRASDRGGTRIVSLHPFTCAFEPFMLFTHYERRLRDALELHRHYFEAANILGASYFIFHGDRWRGSASSSYGHSVCTDEEYFQRFALLRDLGKEYGVTVLQENVSRCRSKDLDFLKRMIAYLGGDVGLVFDNKQALRSGVAWEDYVREVGKYVAHVHISDSGPEGDCLPLGKGNAPILPMLSALRAQGFDGAVMVELYGEYISSTAAVYESYAYLQSHGPDLL